MRKKNVHLAIVGNIGAGKTTLTKLLAEYFSATPLYENSKNNPYLTNFYEDMKRWAFNLQIYFLRDRFEQNLKINNVKTFLVQDRTIYEDAHIFASTLRDMHLLSSCDFNSYMSFFQTIMPFVKHPDLIIYLKAPLSKLVEQINQRNRTYEKDISIDYLNKLNEKYDAWIKKYNYSKKLTIRTNNTDFVNNKKDFDALITKIKTKINIE